MTKIEWAEAVWNPTIGCTIVDHRCTHCYAMRDAYRKQFNPNAKIRAAYEGTVRMANGFPVWTGKVNLLPDRLEVPLRRRKPTTYFVDSMSDLFHPNVPDDFIDRVFAVMALCPQHRFIVLTKRAQRMDEYTENRKKSEKHWESAARAIGCTFTFFDLDGREHSTCPFPLPNVILGTSASDQATFDAAAPHMRALADAGWPTVWSLEPLLGPVNLDGHLSFSRCAGCGEPASCACNEPRREFIPGIKWVIVGGESGPGARPCNVQWIRDIVRQCKDAGVPVFVKQLGAKPYDGTVATTSIYDRDEDDPRAWLSMRDRKGGDMDEWPEDLRVRELPEVSRDR